MDKNKTPFQMKRGFIKLIDLVINKKLNDNPCSLVCHPVLYT